MPHPHQLDDQEPPLIHRPDTPAAVGEVIRQAGAAGLAVFPLGGRTMLDVGLAPDRGGVGVDLTALTQVIDYPARDMTVTVQAGLRVAELQRLLAGEGQRLPIDVPLPERATLGGSLAVNVSGSRRLGAGTLRDYVIGITTVNDEGHETKAGGRVVKNVAGYDLCKLHIGALGTLGVITQVTLKVRPRPETQAVLTFGCGDGELAGLLDRLHAGRTRPMCLDVLNAPLAAVVRQKANVSLPDSPWVVLVGYEDSEAAVKWQIQQLIRELTPAGVEALAGAVTDPLWQAITDQGAGPEARLSLKASLLPGRTAAFCLAADRLEPRPLLHAHAGSGVIRAHFGADLTEGRAGEMLKGLAALAEAGHVVLPRCPAEWKRRLPVWGRPRPDLALMRRVKEKLDPRRLFNPGRFVGGL